MQATYGIDVREVLWGERPWGVNRLWRYVRNLPPSGALHRSVDPQGHAWRNEHELLALQTELLHTVIRDMRALGGDKTHVKPLQIPRPNSIKQAASEPRQASSTEEIRNFMSARGMKVGR